MEMERINVALEKEKFTNQLRLFRRTVVLITVHGQGAANTIFLPPKVFVRNDLDHAKKLVWMEIFVCEYGTD